MMRRSLPGTSMSLDFKVSDVIPATPRAIYDAWLDSHGHAGMTGGQPASCSTAVGGTFTVWNGFITGKNLALEPGKRIVQSWRTTRFKSADPPRALGGREEACQSLASSSLTTFPNRQFGRRIGR